MAKRIMAALVSASLVAVSPSALAQTPAPSRDGATSVRDLPVVSTRTVTTRDPRSATCEQLIDNDPQFRALVGIAAKGGDAYFELRLPGMPNLPVPKSAPSALFAPTVYQPTRLPLDVDQAAEPLTPPGSALPDVRQRKGRTIDTGAPAIDDEPDEDRIPAPQGAAPLSS